MKRKTLKLKGLHTLRLCTFLHGFLNGRMKTAALDAEHGHLNSAYIHGRIHLFHELCKKRVIQFEYEVSDLSATAWTYMTELRTLRNSTETKPIAVPAPLLPESQNPESITTAQARRAAAADARIAAADAAAQKEQQSNALARRDWIIRQLIRMRETLMLKERICTEEISATAEALKERFCIYGHGALLKPVRPSHIPPICCEEYLASCYAAHDALKTKLDSLLEEEVG